MFQIFKSVLKYNVYLLQDKLRNYKQRLCHSALQILIWSCNLVNNNSRRQRNEVSKTKIIYDVSAEEILYPSC